MSAVSAVHGEFDPSGIFLNTASTGLPPQAGVNAVTRAVAGWSHGEVAGPSFDPAIARSRELYAALIGVDLDDVAIGSQSSVLAGMVAASLPDGAEVLIAEGDFTSVTYPFLAQRDRGVVVREAPVASIADALTSTTSLVAVSSAQSADGTLLDLPSLLAARDPRTRVLLDLTQSAGWLPLDVSEADYTICSAYKWLMAPRGAAFLTVRPELRDEVALHNAGWFGGENVWASVYGSRMRLAANARRFDVSPAWFSWAGLVPALELLHRVGVPAVHEHSVALADRFLKACGLPARGSAITAVPVDEAVAPALQSARIASAMRAGRLRLSFYLYNDENDLDRAVETVKPYLAL